MSVCKLHPSIEFVPRKVKSKSEKDVSENPSI